MTASSPAGRRPAHARDVDHSPDFDDTASILQVTMEAILVDEYAQAPATAREAATPRWRRLHVVGYAVALLAVGLVATVAVVQSQEGRPALAAEQAALVQRVQEQNALSDRLSDRSQSLADEVAALRATSADADGALNRRLDTLRLRSGALPVHGPGIVVTVDDAPDPNTAGQVADPQGRILDIDLQHLVNGLWAAGAEAVAINGERLTSTTAIRAAGQAITVGYRPLARPYVITAIGDGRTLAGRFAETDGGMWMANLAAAHGVVFGVETSRDLRLPADSGLSVRYAAPLRDSSETEESP